MTQPAPSSSDSNIPTTAPAEPAPTGRRRTVRIVAALAVIATLLILGRALTTPAQSSPASASATPGPAAPQVGHYAPNATLLDLSNRQVDINSLRGKVVVLNFWYVACQPCLYEMPALEQAYVTYASKGVVVVGVNISDDAQTISTFIQRLGITYPILRDLGERVALQYQLTATPTSFVLDRQGVIRYRQVGPFDTPTLKTEITAVLNMR
ncbi:MAG TPA: TlpA disulfide reductase family protein [Ktedonobacterales bacterium]|nr:TlpA disulfide reductase family protein [Ktedonobacterales bacterium]